MGGTIIGKEKKAEVEEQTHRKSLGDEMSHVRMQGAWVTA
jgi:hypothetical protein